MGQQTIFGQFGQSSEFSSSHRPGQAVDSAANGGVAAWTNPGNVTTPAGAASVALNNSRSHQLLMTFATFNVPANATIVGVQAAFWMDNLAGASANAAFDATSGATIVRGGVAIASSIPSAFVPTNFLGPGGTAQVLLGGPSDTWGVALTPADVNGFLQFGFSIAFFSAGTATVVITGPVALTVFYTLPTSSGVILRDSSSNAVQSQWTDGATIIAPVGAGPSLTAPWKIVGWGVSYLGQLVSPTLAVGGYGLLGALWGGLVLGSPTVTLGPIPWVNPVQPFPGDQSTLQKIWDGSQDPPFGHADGPSTVANVPNVARYNQQTFPMPLPITLQPGDQVAIGLWLTPGLLYNTLVQVAAATWSVTYDDGI